LEETKPQSIYRSYFITGHGNCGQEIDDEDLRELMKENGIGRSSTRANIIETLFRRQYIIRNKNKFYL
jgi:DNA topoisomerase-3